MSDIISTEQVTVEKPRKWSLMELEVLFPEDEGWTEEFSGKLIADSNREDAEDYDSDQPSFHGVAYVPPEIDLFVLHEELVGHGKFKFPEGVSVNDLQKYCTSYALYPKVPVCKNLVVGMNNMDPAIDLYDRPYTMLPLEDSCIAKELGHSPKLSAPCAFAETGNFPLCSAYEAWEPTVIGTIGDVDIVLDRTSKGNTYTYNEMTFSTYKELLEHCTNWNLTFNLTYDPTIKDPVAFFPAMVERLEIAYGKHEQSV